MEMFTVLPAYVKDLYSFVLGEYQINTFEEITLTEIFKYLCALQSSSSQPLVSGQAASPDILVRLLGNECKQ